MITVSTLNTPASTLTRVKYFIVPLYLANMLPTTTYTASINGNNIGQWCKPRGGKLGDPLTSDSTGKLQLTYMLSIPYNTTYLTNPSINAGLLQQNKQITFTDPLGRTSITYLPVTLKSN